MDAQRYHDENQPDPAKLSLEGSRERLEALLKAKNGPSGEPPASVRHVLVDPIAQAMKHHPGLTREEADRMAAEYGY
jgi:hypothetical protein